MIGGSIILSEYLNIFLTLLQIKVLSSNMNQVKLLVIKIFNYLTSYTKTIK